MREGCVSEIKDVVEIVAIWRGLFIGGRRRAWGWKGGLEDSPWIRRCRRVGCHMPQILEVGSVAIKSLRELFSHLKPYLGI